MDMMKNVLNKNDNSNKEKKKNKNKYCCPLKLFEPKN